MRGGGLVHLMRRSDGSYHVGKFQNNFQNRRVLVNELLATILAVRLGLPTTPIAIVDVREQLIRLTPDAYIEMHHTRIPCQPGLQFGSRYPADPHRVTLLDFMPDKELLSVEHLNEFVGMLVFDKWTCNTDGCPVIFDRPDITAGYQAWMIDLGFCFNGAEWNCPDAPRRSLNFRTAVYEQVRGIESIAPWLTGLQSEIGAELLLEVAKTLPPERYELDSNSLRRLLERLDYRRKVVSQLLWSAWKSSPQVFPKWSERIGTEEETNHVTQIKSSLAVNCCTERLALEPSY